MDATTDEFEKISLIQTDGDQTPIVLASNVLTTSNKILVDLPKDLVPSNDYYMVLGEPPNDCKSGNLRVIGITEALKIKKVVIQIRPGWDDELIHWVNHEINW
ncbi:hypothetical protein RO3G_13369 [Rhizopus delemar RA 99-880]|uniref:Uncharacterized protein n=1 Tax=Rhizopus delemar (strain RA 99-880 / ATCC MYA-4621 / FGSC 9543 / NRRL 43880) TaxID=246409 RepID=I1CJM8_RHIO9|nr:hypothetical protein RO3G_13369 [Rhizopus delemar RA 99-880]|eukprot:EIE88658.1 hypothetical protein RO3G_13369 [Rhizopus delemar RA 99-880]